ncbi:MAG: hypothetical protein NT028_11620 [candidate division Zixibacteria bacterium]|nr:hypothetical protein [candidate division Zixibacteria bacterium]
MNKKLKTELTDDLRPEYDLRKLLKHGVRGKYYRRYHEGTNVVLLQPDIAKAFPTEAAVNDALRLVIKLTRLQTPKKRRALAS